MQDDMVDALNSLEYDEAEAYSQRLLSIDPESGMAWTVAGLIEIGKYITYENAERLLEDFEKAVEYAKGDDYDNIMEVVKDHIERYLQTFFRMIKLKNVLKRAGDRYGLLC